MKRIVGLLMVATAVLLACREPVQPQDPSLPSFQLSSEAGLGSKIAFTKFSESQDQNEDLVAEIYVMNGDGTEQRRLTHNTTSTWAPWNAICFPFGDHAALRSKVVLCVRRLCSVPSPFMT